jgi:outer membrane protein assembly factor BamD (BamD/ComL family)
MTLKYPFLLVASIALFACNSPKEKALQRIKDLEAKDSVFSPQLIEETKAAYLDFATKYPDDELAPEYIFKAGQRCNVMADHEEAIGLFQRVIDQYPRNRASEEALFLQAYIYENHLHQDAKARELYTTFISKYPKSELREDAEAAIRNMGKTPEEILESFNQKENAQGNP